MDFETALSRAWSDHADDARAVAARWAELQMLITDDAQIERLATLMHHVHGTHLADWHGGMAALETLRELAPYSDAGASGAARRRMQASLAICAGAPTPDETLTPSDRIRVAALAADNLVAHDTPRAAAALRRALEQAAHSGLPDSDPMQRALAAAANNIACELEERPARSAGDRALMLLAAQAARTHWARAGGWLETERAEYRLAMSWLKAGDPGHAREHAQACLAIVAAHGAPALEQFFGAEALARAERAAGNPPAHAAAQALAQAAFDALGPDDQAWCRPSLEALAG